MEKKYQVFISSTYEDLLEERKEVSQVLLEFNCIPVGMELFPASNEDQWTFIKRIISECDYYVVIIAGRYGSCSDTGMSYTEMEYRYAVEIGMPVIAFLPKDPKLIPSGKTESESDKRAKLTDFRELAKQKLCKFYSNPHELGSVVIRSLNELQKRYPAIGWVRGDTIASQESTVEILRLRKENEELKEKVKSLLAPKKSAQEGLSSGDEFVQIHFNFKATDPENEKGRYHSDSIALSWNSLFGLVAYSLMTTLKESKMREVINGSIEVLEKSRISKIKKFKGFHIGYFSVNSEDFKSMIIQFMALRLIRKTGVSREMFNEEVIYGLTEYGEQLMFKLKAKKKLE